MEATETKEVKSTEKDLKSSILKGIVRFVLPLALTILLVWYMFSKVDFKEMMGIIRQGVDYWWILLMMGVSVLSHVCRAYRWRIQLNALDIRPPAMALCCSIFGTYALNLVFPRLGEVWRCTYISSREKAPFTKVIGSMVADRLSDTIVVASLLLLTFVVAFSAIDSFLNKYPIGRDLMAMLANPYFWLAIVGAIVVIALICKFTWNTKIMLKLREALMQMWRGFAVVGTMPHRGRFLLLTLAIWTCYFMQLYISFFAFSFTRDLVFEHGTFFGLVPALVAFVLSSIGMAIPSNGGLGPWNIAVMFGLAIYGISDAQGTAFSMLVWTAQTVMLIILGIYTMVYISLSPKQKTTPHEIQQ